MSARTPLVFVTVVWIGGCARPGPAPDQRGGSALTTPHKSADRPAVLPREWSVYQGRLTLQVSPRNKIGVTFDTQSNCFCPTNVVAISAIVRMIELTGFIRSCLNYLKTSLSEQEKPGSMDVDRISSTPSLSSRVKEEAWLTYLSTVVFLGSTIQYSATPCLAYS